MTPEKAAERYHWISFDPGTNVIELYLDHHMLSGKRTCEVKYYLEHLLNIRPKGHKSWSLAFGAWLHFSLQEYYQYLKDHEGKPIDVGVFLQNGRARWDKMKLDAYKGEKKYDEIHGWEGASVLLVEYWAIYLEQRMRVVGVEIPFGREEKVFIGEFYLDIDYHEPVLVRCFLTGRIDLLVDNGSTIGPVDHKHTHVFRGDEWMKFNPSDGITGYIYATSFILAKYFPEYKPSATTGWIFHIQGKSPSYKNVRKGDVAKPRFKASRHDKDSAQLEDYKARNLSTFKRIAELLFCDVSPEWNTNVCHFLFGRKCEYLPIHETKPSEWNYIIQNHYNQTTEWDPAHPEESYAVREEFLTDAALLLAEGEGE